MTECLLPDEILLTGIRYYLALKDVIVKYGYKGITINDVDGMKKLLGFPPSMIFMLLAQELGVCTVPENDVMGSAMQLIIKELTGQIGLYLEFYEFFKDRVLMGVPDYVPNQSCRWTFDGEGHQIWTFGQLCT